jgi:hypothetical protein
MAVRREPAWLDDRHAWRSIAGCRSIRTVDDDQERVADQNLIIWAECDGLNPRAVDRRSVRAPVVPQIERAALRPHGQMMTRDQRIVQYDLVRGIPSNLDN